MGQHRNGSVPNHIIEQIAAQQEQMQAVQQMRNQDHARSLIRDVHHGAALLLAAKPESTWANPAVIAQCADLSAQLMTAAEGAFNVMVRLAQAKTEAGQKPVEKPLVVPG